MRTPHSDGYLRCPLAEGKDLRKPFFEVEEGRDELKQQVVREPPVVPNTDGSHIFKGNGEWDGPTHRWCRGTELSSSP
jgi:hypothetical protein